MTGPFLRSTRKLLGLTRLELYNKTKINPATLHSAEQNPGEVSSKMRAILKPKLHSECLKRIDQLTKRAEELG